MVWLLHKVNNVVDFTPLGGSYSAFSWSRYDICLHFQLYQTINAITVDLVKYPYRAIAALDLPPSGIITF